MFAKKQPETCCYLCSCQSWLFKERFYAFKVFAQDSLEEGNNNSVVYLMHGITPVHQIDAEVRYEPERVETKVGPRLLSLRFIVPGA